MKAHPFIYTLICVLVLNCAATSGVVYDYNLDVDFNQFDTYVLCVEDLTVKHEDRPKFDNINIRNLIGDAISVEMENKAHRTDVFEPQLQAGFKLIISEETAQFNNCEHSQSLEFWEKCKIHEQTFLQESLVAYVADFASNRVLWHATIVFDVNTSKKKLQPYIEALVEELFETYPKTQVGRHPDDAKEM